MKDWTEGDIRWIAVEAIGERYRRYRLPHAAAETAVAACVLGYRVRYATSAELLRDLTACLADHGLPQRLRYYSNFELLVIDEFGFEQMERTESTQAASLLYKVVDSRGPKRSTALVTNIGFEAWADYLGDAPLAMTILDRLFAHPKAERRIAQRQLGGG